ncbi:MAG: hypothetical protein CME64_15140 [Halobacteriovoraceae bacterium]|nr:hypothetical protein [Halobacteriovoraceae bacterium]|tara:strand:+ start:70382 stop:71104 length:723 start_codon:yes stop_codon:yes gene_type:complete
MEINDTEIDSLFDDDISFKPITKGLGFHHGEKSGEEKLDTLKARSLDLEKSLNERASQINKTKSVAQTPKSANLLSTKDLGELAPFYASEDNKDTELDINVSDPVEVEEASAISRLLAFGVDLGIISSAFGLMILSTLLASGISLGVVRESLNSMFFITTVLPLAVMFYLFYFTFFDKTVFSTPGKKIVGIAVVANTSDRVKMTQSFSRALLSLASVFTLGMPSILDFHSKITDTKVVKK